MAFKCTVLTPEAQLLDQVVMQVIIPAHDGLMGILTGRSPLIVKLGIGPMRIDTAEGKKLYYFVDGGVAQMKGETLSVLTSAATLATEIDHQAAVDEYNAAMERRAIAPAEVEERDKAVQRARVKRALTAHL
jgi:F-type H+-transporting ATPase subunit epsilon